MQRDLLMMDLPVVESLETSLVAIQVTAISMSLN